MATPKEIVREVNQLRENPKEYAKKVSKYLEYFKDDIIKVPGTNIGVKTQEGQAPYKETVEYLESLEPREPFVASKALCEIAQEILAKIKDSETGDIDDGDAEEIIDKHGNFTGKFTRAMDFGGFSSEQVVINFLVCDGDPNRTQRDPVMNEGLKKVGVAYGKHDLYQSCAVLVSCTDFENTVDPDDIPIYPETNEVKEQLDKIKEAEKQKELERQKAREAEEQRQRDLARQKEEEAREKAEAERQAKYEQKRAEELKRLEEKKKREAEKNKPVVKPFRKQFVIMSSVGSDEPLPEGVKSIKKTDRITFKAGKRYKIITTIKTMDDGSEVKEEEEQCLDKD